MMGNEALAEAAVLAGCRFFAGYPITPSSEIIEYLSWRLPQAGGTCIQAESEVSAINMLCGASSAGVRAMTASSGLGISLMCEGFSNMAVLELPAVIVNMSRGGPGSGHLGPSQGDYFQATKGGGHGDYRMVVYGPSTGQEMVDLTQRAFWVADEYRTPTMILGDSLIAHIMETVDIGEPEEEPLPEKTWVNDGCRGRDPIKTIAADIPTKHRIGDEEFFEKHVERLQEKYRQIEQQEVRAETKSVEGAEVIVVAFGSAARICREAIGRLTAQGLKVGLVRPISLWPFPKKAVAEAAAQGVPLLVVELSSGQMVEDVRLAVEGRAPVHFYGRVGGMYPSVGEVVERIQGVARGVPADVSA